MENVGLLHGIYLYKEWLISPIISLMAQIYRDKTPFLTSSQRLVPGPRAANGNGAARMVQNHIAATLTEPASAA
ncbi:hypothetical protein BK025_08195 [Sodalis sp. TME1]|nr:hypothetical protein BK025_08195 [Sodalis sp. TME1]